MTQSDSPRRGVRFGLRTAFFTGVIVAAPVGLTVYLMWEFVSLVDNLVKPVIPPQYSPERYLDIAIPGLGLVIAVLFLTLVGFVAANVLGRTIGRVGELMVARMPVVRSVYGALKQIFETVLAQSSRSFREVVLIEYPRAGIWTIGLVTGETAAIVKGTLARELATVFVPTAPNPTSGFLLFVPPVDLIRLDMTVEEALKFVISGGIVTPSKKSAASLQREEKPSRANS
ncbi:MAG: DUF502 domain-containing protein [Alphaproteobacteria bacterium]|nr:DUF502 domain-containing protein [Alphaproteobacteria bacterium]